MGAKLRPLRGLRRRLLAKLKARSPRLLEFGLHRLACKCGMPHATHVQDGVESRAPCTCSLEFWLEPQEARGSCFQHSSVKIASCIAAILAGSFVKHDALQNLQYSLLRSYTPFPWRLYSRRLCRRPLRHFGVTPRL